MKRSCKCGHTEAAHDKRNGKCRALLCECGAFRRGAVLVIKPRSREQVREEMSLLAQERQPSEEDALIRAAFATVAPSTHLKIWPLQAGLSVQFYVPAANRGAQLEMITGKTGCVSLEAITIDEDVAEYARLGRIAETHKIDCACVDCKAFLVQGDKVHAKGLQA